MTPFYERSSEERVRLTEEAIREQRTLMERWTALEDDEASHWNARAALAAAFLAAQPAVSDFGCGTMVLERMLAPGQRYVPLDVVARDPRTIVCDLNVEPPPLTHTPAAALLGVVEYLHDPAAVLARLAQSYRILVVSYCVTDAIKPFPERREHGWVNDFDTAQAEALFTAAGWAIVEAQVVDHIQTMWKLASTTVTAPKAASPIA